MGNCKLVDELNRLRKSSSDSIDGINSFDGFKKYMHVERRAEIDLVEIINQVNASNRKTLVLLCGSAGDGKSHLLSYLKNETHILDEYTVYNDATESSSPSRTAIETLNEVLQDFSDSKIALPGKNFIFAINLGVLSNFIESSFGENFQQLRNYVIENNILTNQLNEGGYHANSSFQHVSFSDYHMYSLTKDGIHPEYLERIIGKVFTADGSNCFYKTYQKECAACPLSEKCPVKHNYEFLMNPKFRSFIAQALVEITIKDKEILTTREILNYVYDIVVPCNFNYSKIAKASINEATFLKEYIRDMTPVLMYEYSDMSSLLNLLQKYDPLLVRSEEADDMAISYYVASDVSKEIVAAVGSLPYAQVLCQAQAIDKINDDKALKAQLFNVIVRLQKMNVLTSEKDAYTLFLNTLFYYNTGNDKKLGHLFELIETAVAQWCGNEGEDTICLDDMHGGISLFETIKFEEYLDDLPTPQNCTELQRFLPFVTAKFEDTKTEDIISLDIDYSLYELIYKLSKGYIQTADDRNNHADFISFISKILRTGSANKKLAILSDDNRKAIIKKTKFGYRFEVVQ